MTAAEPNTPAQSELAQKLANVAVTLREDLEVSRHVFQQTPTYIIRDPVTFATHRFDAHDYDILVRINSQDTLAETFDSLVEEGALDPEDQDDFYNFILYLHRAALLNLPFSDHASLFKRYQKRTRAKAIATALSPFFLRVPLWNPDPFLDRTKQYVSWLFTRWALLAWAMLIATAGAVAYHRREDLAAPLLTALEIENLPLLWVILIGLKVIHEFGHAYACKAFGGRVPDMGAFFIVGTPAAYVDASAAWGFHDVKQRMTVNLAGVYVESICAAIAVLVWASTPPGLLATAAYQVALMASVVTLGFNINPLAKFDGYYVLADLSGIPNLRQRASEQLTRLFNKLALGMPVERSEFSPFTQLLLACYGLSAALYRVTVVIGLSAVIATKLFVVGLAMAAYFVATTLYGLITKAVRYLWFSETTAPVRARAIAVSILCLAAGVLTLLVIPSGHTVRIAGVVQREHQRVIHAPANGFVADAPPDPGTTILTNAPLLTLDDPEAELAQQQAAADLDLAELRIEAADQRDTTEVAQSIARLAHAKQANARAASRVSELNIMPEPGDELIAHERPLEPGVYIKLGEPLLRVGSGDWVIRALADAPTIAAANITAGSEINCRTSLDPTIPITGTVVSIADAANRMINAEALTQAAGGPITVNTNSGEATEPFVEITVRIDAPPQALHHGATAWVRLEARPEPLAFSLTRDIRRFAADLSTR